MRKITFIDTEVEPKSGRILDLGGAKLNGDTFHSSSNSDFVNFLKDSDFIGGHNILMHDLKYIGDFIKKAKIREDHIVDTLFLSPLLFPSKPYHALVKDDKLQSDQRNNPLNDALNAKCLFHDEEMAFIGLDEDLRNIFYALLYNQSFFKGFFNYLELFQTRDIELETIIRKRFRKKICFHAPISILIEEAPVELAYALAIINANSRDSITPPWVVKNMPYVERAMHLLRNKPCIEGCEYCNEALDIHKGLERFFGYSGFRSYAGEPLQEKAVNAAVKDKSLLAIFPTGGGKSITFQLPALMSGQNVKGLTVVISPLQSLMKDQVDNLESVGITEAVTINGLLDPIERAKSFERVQDGSASLIYISPESLRSRTIEHLLLGRNVVRFVIDEAHCFSAWGQDFRVDYLYIGDFINNYQKKKNLPEKIPVSCFTATAKQNVIADIKEYFKENLSIDLEVFKSGVARSNLSFCVFLKESEEEKYSALRFILEEKNCPTIVYVSRTKRAKELADRLNFDGFFAKPYHGKMDIREKTENQDAFIRGEIDIMVATSAFGMGVDKKDVGVVIHYDISDSLENYVQEAGRAGRDESISASCYILFNDEDLNKHFILLNQNKLNIQEIQQIWKAIKEITQFRNQVSQSALEIARRAGWNDGISEIETRVKTAISALEQSGYIKRGQNMPRIFANSILVKNAQEAIEKINNSPKFQENQKENAVRIIKKLFSSKSRSYFTDETAESRVDYISDYLGIVKEEVIHIINILREEQILADAKDLSAFINRRDNINHSLTTLESYRNLERILIDTLSDEAKIYNLKEINEQASKLCDEDFGLKKLKTILNIWTIKHWIRKKERASSKNHIAIESYLSKKELEEKMVKRQELAEFIVRYLFEKNEKENNKNENDQLSSECKLVEFSVLELKLEFENRLSLYKSETSFNEIEDALFYLSRIESLKIEGGFLVVYNAMTIERLEKDNKRRYKKDDYKKLEQFYENKVEQIHIVGEYARKMIEDYKDALRFVDDYFQLNYTSFLNKYFKGSRQGEIKRNITPAKFNQIFAELSPSQLSIIKDNNSKSIVVAAGPGSGKTRILVHKLASLLLMEDVKHEQMLMVTFSRASASEFKKRLIQLIGNAAHYIEIKTFHSYCFDLLGKIGSLEKSGEVISETIRRIKEKDVDMNRLTKAVLVIDEAQDMDINEFQLVQALMEYNENMRVIAVGDDDQNIYQFRGSNSKFMMTLAEAKHLMIYELIDNYRSKKNLVDFTNKFALMISNRIKKTQIHAVQSEIGLIKVACYSSEHIITPLVDDLLSENLSGTVSVLTCTNDEALQVAGLLRKNGMKAKLIQSNDGFNLTNLLEIRFMLTMIESDVNEVIIHDECINKVKRMLDVYFPNSTNRLLCLRILDEFVAINPKMRYKSDFRIFIRESKLEDFYNEDHDVISVSTIHKSKGREFDHVFLLLEGVNLVTDEDYRQLYVAMTRAKNKLSIHYNGSYLEGIQTENITRLRTDKSYQPPTELIFQLSHKDVWLDHFQFYQKDISELYTGQLLAVCEDGCCTNKGKQVLKFSRHFIDRITYYKNRNYFPFKAIIANIVYWSKENTEHEIKIFLPEVYFRKEN
ncbi:MAG: RecQ family ATP-dependent DNA helicase [Tissierellales bacterium]|nr:RecQ family ATP-dependent DNA helicase [Tissierellales bacterium]MBN2827936.1 RecQ family ATP-dependent DNA helicase [Tissierellales bacterium]